MKKSTAAWMLVLAAILWSSAGILIKSINLHPLTISGSRSLVAAFFLLLITRHRRFSCSLPMLGGAVAYATAVTCLVVATRMTTAANAVLLMYTAPIFVAVFGIWYLKEIPEKGDWITLAVAAAGMGLFFVDDLSFRSLGGNLAGLLSGIAYGWLALFLRKQKDGSPIESVIIGNLLAALIASPYMIEELPRAGGVLPWLVLLGIGQMGVPYFLFATALRHVPALEALLIGTIEPILNPLWVVLLVGEVPSPCALTGGAVIIGSICLRALCRHVPRPCVHGTTAGALKSQPD